VRAGLRTRKIEMRDRNSNLPPNHQDPNLLHHLFFVQQVGLILVGQIALIVLLSQGWAHAHEWIPDVLLRTRPSTATACLLCAVALFLAEPERSLLLHRLAKALAVVAACEAAFDFLSRMFILSIAFPAFLSDTNGVRMQQPALSPAPPLALFLIAAIILLASAEGMFLIRVGDILTTILCFLVLMLCSAELFAQVGIPGAANHGMVSGETLLCLVLLTVAVVLRRSDQGLFRIFLGYGLGSRLARAWTPIMLFLPPLREVARARLGSTHLLAAQYAPAILTAAGTVLGIGLLFWLGSRINGMQGEIQNLSLRDELTGLHNVRGFNLLAEQAMRMARRAQQPFAVIFFDLDNLKVINDKLGHSAGSAALAEMARILTDTFRETDVIGRVGGDEFLVAGQFEESSIEGAIDRLNVRASEAKQRAGSIETLHFSSGYATMRSDFRETLKDMVTRADKAMYDEKRLKKPGAA
jgi:diguanylate cyclase (GGDEF)-like protein